MAATLEYAGQNELLTCQLVLLSTKAEVDISRLVFQIEVYEDIMSSFISGNIVLVDANNLISSLPIVGEEMLVIEYRTPQFEEKVRLLLHVYKCSDRLMKGMKQAYTLHFVSMQAYYDTMQRVSAAFSGKPDEIANQVYRKYLQTDAEREAYNAFLAANPDAKLPTEYQLSYDDYKCINDIKFTSNFWNPSRIINYCASLAQYNSDAGGDSIPNFLYYQGTKDNYFIPLDQLYAQEPAWEYIYDKHPGTKHNQDGEAVYDLERQMKSIHHIEFLENFDYLKRSMSGALSHQVFEFNLLNKRWSAEGSRIRDKENSTVDNQQWWNGPRTSPANETGTSKAAYDLGGYYYNYHYYSDWDKTWHLDDGIEPNNETVKDSKHKDPGRLQGRYLSWNDVNAKVSTKITHSGSHAGIKDRTADILAKRLSLLSHTEMVKFRITVPAKSDLEVGETIMLRLPMMRPLGDQGSGNAIDEGDIYDEYWSGKYLITNIRHVITGKDHMAVIDICRDAVSKKFTYIWPGAKIDPAGEPVDNGTGAE